MRLGGFLDRTPSGDVKAAVGAFFEIYKSIGDMVMRLLRHVSSRVHGGGIPRR